MRRGGFAPRYALFHLPEGAMLAAAIASGPLAALAPTKSGDEAPWSAYGRQVDEALATRELGAAKLAWHRAYVAALGSRKWEGMIEVGDAYLRIGRAARGRKAAEAKAREAYLSALFRARSQQSIDGVLRAAEAFGALGDQELVEQSLRIAERLAAKLGDEQGRNRIRTWRGPLHRPGPRPAGSPAGP